MPKLAAPIFVVLLALACNGSLTAPSPSSVRRMAIGDVVRVDVTADDPLCDPCWVAHAASPILLFSERPTGRAP